MRIASRTFGLTVVGFGLVLLGAAVWNMAVDSAAVDATQATDFSSVPASVWFEAPTLALRDLQGEQHSLAEYRGTVVLVNLWATWCPPCEAEMPNLQRYYQAHQGQGFVVIAIEDGDPSQQVRAFATAHGLTFPIWLDPTYQATDQAFKTADLPSSYVIDRHGRVRMMWVGAISESNLEKYVSPLIEE